MDAEDVRTKETDDRGRLNLGTEYADKKKLTAAYRDASENAAAFTDELDEASDEAWTELDESGTNSKLDV